MRLYTTEDIGILHQGFVRGSPLLDLEEILGRNYYQILRKIKALSKRDPERWDSARVAEYERQREEICAYRTPQIIRQWKEDHKDEITDYNARYYRNKKNILESEKRRLMDGLNKPELVFDSGVYIPDDPFETSFPLYIVEFLEANIWGLELELRYTQHIETKNTPPQLFKGRLTNFRRTTGLEDQILQITSDGQTFELYSREINSLSVFWKQIYARSKEFLTRSRI